MKRFLVMLAIMAIAMTGVFAAEGTGSYVLTDELTGATTDKATLEVTLDLTPESEYGRYYQIGFTKEDNVASFTADDLESIEPVKTIALATLTETDDLTNSDVNVYWAIRIPSDESVNIGLKLGGNMTASSSDPSGIKWSVTPGEGATKKDALTTTAVGEGGAASEEAVVSVQGTGALAFGSFPITISTVDLRTTAIEYKKYSAELTVMVTGD